MISIIRFYDKSRGFRFFQNPNGDSDQKDLKIVMFDLSEVANTVEPIIIATRNILRWEHRLSFDDGDDINEKNDDDDDMYIMVKCLYVCHVFAYFVFPLPS